MNKIIKNILFTFVGALLFFSCRYNVPLEKDEYLLWRQNFKGNQKVLTEELETLIPVDQKENTKPFNLPFTPRVRWYSFGKNVFNVQKQERKLTRQLTRLNQLPQTFESIKITRKKQKIEKKVSRLNENLNQQVAWFWRNIGEIPATVKREEIEETSKKIEKFLMDIGYREASVNFRIDSTISKNPRKILLTYQIKENEPYLIDSVIYNIPDPHIDSLIRANEKTKLIQPGNRFDKRLVDAERLRIESLLKNNGYYNFSGIYLTHGASNAQGDYELFKSLKRGNLYFEISNPPGRDIHEKFTVKEVVFKAFDPNATQVNLQPDTLVYNGIRFITLDKRIPISIVSNRVLTRAGKEYKIDDIIETQRQMGLMNQFAFASSQVKVTAPNSLSLEYFAPLLEKYTVGTSPGLNSISNDGSNFYGFGIPVSLTVRNMLKRLEVFEGSVKASYEGQPSPLITSGKPKIRGSLELGANANLSFPTLILLPLKNQLVHLKNPKTTIGLGFNYSEPFWGQRLNFKLSSNYSFQPSKYSVFYFSILDANLVNTNYSGSLEGRNFYKSLVDQQALGNNLKVTFDPQFVSSINTNFVFNNQDLRKPYATSRFLRVFLESGGTSLNFLKNKERLGFIENLFPLRHDNESPDSVRAYFRFVKLNIDFRKYVNVSPSSSLAYRVNFGVTNPYGRNKALPYEKNFFAGGSNSVRAWSPRSLGVGSAKPDTTIDGNTFPQPGDILMEGSVEYRAKVARFAGDIQVAAFIDAGNVWKWHEVNIPSKANKANFDFSRFYKEFAVGTGLGLRWDLSYFLFRFDWGIKVVDPSRAVGDRFVLDEFSLRRKMPYGLQWNFGIGYPF